MRTLWAGARETRRGAVAPWEDAVVASCNVVFDYAGRLVEVEFAVGPEPPGGPGWMRVPIGGRVLWIRSANGGELLGVRPAGLDASDATFRCPLLGREIVCRYDLAEASAPAPPGFGVVRFGPYRLALMVVLPEPAVVGHGDRLAI